MKELYYYNSVAYFYSENAFLSNKIAENYPGMELFRSLFELFAKNMTFFDRTGTLTVPIRVARLPQLKLPEYRVLSESFEELCALRARQLLHHAITTDRKIAIMYSGGIDSTLILVTILKEFSQEDIDKRVMILMNEMSIDENVNFYHSYVLKHFKNIRPSDIFGQYIGNDKYIYITGEGNDQLFGSMVTRKMVTRFGEESMLRPLARGDIFTFIDYCIEKPEHSEKITELLFRLSKTAPIPIETPFHLWWWLNLTCKYQSVFVRSLGYTSRKNQFSVSLFDNYQMFFDLPEMQLWAMNHSDNLIDTTWRSYKHECKRIIYDFNGDTDYRDNKVKYGSLKYVLRQKDTAISLDTQGKFYYDYPGDEILNPVNSFTI
jgi:hypothetical protein